jgi:hypothetical protein
VSGAISASTRTRCGTECGRWSPVRGRRRDLLMTDGREELRLLRREVVQLRHANAILKGASVDFATELDPNAAYEILHRIGFYNDERLHEALGNLLPCLYERLNYRGNTGLAETT